MTTVCGTGGWGGPLPGDPDNNSILTASPAFGGIDVSWTMPTTNPNAVAHVKVYRNVFPIWNTAILLGTSGGSSYFDKTNSTTEYFYWIQIVSVNGGPPGEPIGPASAIGRPMIADVIAGLTNQIDSGLLAMSLKADIDKIALNYSELVAEIGERLSGDAALSQALAAVQSGLEDAMAFINTEVTTRIQGDTALIQQIDTMAAVNQQTAALVSTEASARVDGDLGLSQRIDLLVASNGDGAVALVATEAQARVDGDDALAQQITTAQVALGDNLASVEVALSTEIDSVAGVVQNIGALYTAKVSVNGQIGGFGIYNDGTEVEAGFDVDRFWVGRTNANRRKPFIIQDDIVYIDEAAINKLTFSKLRDETGGFIVEDGQVRASYIDTKGLSIKDNLGNVIFSSGTALNYDRIGGTNKPQNGATVGATIGTNLSGQITAANASTFIAAAAIGTAEIANASITNAKIGTAQILEANIGDGNITTAKIGDLQVNTLKIAGNAVTIPTGAFTAAEMITNNSGWFTAQSLYFVSSGAPVIVFVDIEAIGGVSGEYTYYQVRLLRNGAVIANRDVGSYYSNFVQSHFFILDQPGVTGVTYTVQVLSVGHKFRNRGIFCLETKR